MKTLIAVMAALAMTVSAYAVGAPENAHGVVAQKALTTIWSAYSNSPYNPELGSTWSGVTGRVLETGTIPESTVGGHSMVRLPAYLARYSYNLSVNGFGKTKKITYVYYAGSSTLGLTSVLWGNAGHLGALKASMLRNGFVPSAL